MCLIISRPQGKTVTKDRLKWGFTNNPDGAGICYVDEGQLMIDKGIYTFDEWYEMYEALGDRDMIIHFRKASPGMEVTEDMCHPFGFDSGKHVETGEGDNVRPRYEFAVAHNGKLSWPDRKPKSDTACFVEDVMGPLMGRDPWFLDNEAGRHMMNLAVNNCNAMAIMRYDVEDDATDIYLVNAERVWSGRVGHYLDGCWFSNHSYIEVTHPYRPNGEFGGSHRQEEWEFLGSSAEEKGWENDPWKVDNLGWKWSYQQQCWINLKSRAKIDKLLYRKWPPYMDAPDVAVSTLATNPIILPPIVVVPDKQDGITAFLPHLAIHDQLSLRRIAKAYAVASLGHDAASLFPMEVIDLLRDDTRLAFSKDAKGLSDEKLDLWIIKKDCSESGFKCEWLIEAQGSMQDSRLK
jgi:hypothetical protein